MPFTSPTQGPEHRRHGWGARGGTGAPGHRMLLCSCQPVHVAGAGSRTPACAAGLQLDPADGSQRGQTRKAGGRGEDMNQSGVPLLAGGSWPVQQLPITQPGSVYSRSTIPHRLPCRTGEENQPQARGWCCHCFSLLLGTIPLLDPRHCCDRCSCHPPMSGTPRHMLELLPLLFIFNKATASDTAHISAPPHHTGMDAWTTQPWVQAGPQDAARTLGTAGRE